MKWVSDFPCMKFTLTRIVLLCRCSEGMCFTFHLPVLQYLDFDFLNPGFGSKDCFSACIRSLLEVFSILSLLCVSINSICLTTEHYWTEFYACMYIYELLDVR